MSEVINHLEDQLVREKTLVKMRDAALRLADNKDFRDLILNGFCLTEAARYVQESGDPMVPAANRADALAMAQASGHLTRFLSFTILMGNTAANTVREVQDAIDEIRAEGSDE